MDTQNIYQLARNSAGITQEKAAEQLGISVESLRNYETGKSIPQSGTVENMVYIYHAQHLAIQHLHLDSLARQWLPDVQPRTLEQATIRIYRLFRDFEMKHRTDTLMDIAEDSVIDEKERPVFDEIMQELNEIVKVSYELRLDGF